MQSPWSLQRSFSFFHSSWSVEALTFLFTNSSLLLALRLRVDGVGFFFFFVGAKSPFLMVSTEKEKLVLI